MATTLAWTCPKCGLSIKTVTTTERGSPDDKHMHMIIEDQATCANLVTPHTWKVTADVVVEKVN